MTARMESLLHDVSDDIDIVINLFSFDVLCVMAIMVNGLTLTQANVKTSI